MAGVGKAHVISDLLNRHEAVCHQIFNSLHSVSCYVLLQSFLKMFFEIAAYVIFRKPEALYERI